MCLLALQRLAFSLPAAGVGAHTELFDSWQGGSAVLVQSDVTPKIGASWDLWRFLKGKKVGAGPTVNMVTSYVIFLLDSCQINSSCVRHVCSILKGTLTKQLYYDYNPFHFLPDSHN